MTRRENLAPAIAGLLVYLALVAALLFATAPWDAASQAAGAGSSRSTAPRGLARLFQAFRAEGLPVRRLDSEESLPTETTLLVVEAERPPPLEARLDIARKLRSGRLNLVVAGTGAQLRVATQGLLAEVIPATRPARGPAWILAEGFPFKTERLRLGSLVRNLEIEAFDELPEGFQILARSADDRPVIIATTQGHGIVVLCSESRWFENAWIGFGDNLECVLGLVGGCAAISFDDRWQKAEEIGTQEPSILALVYGTTGGRAVIFAALTLLFAVYLAGLHPGAPPRPAPSKRSPTLFVDSLADLHLAAGRGADAYSHFRQLFCIRAARAVGLPPTCSIGELADTVGQRIDVDAQEIVDLVSEYPSPRRVPSWVARLDALTEALRR